MRRTSGCARTTSARARTGRSRASPSPRGSRAASSTSRCSARSSRARPPTSSCSTTPRPAPVDRRRASPATGSSRLSSRHVRDVMVAGEWVVSRPPPHPCRPGRARGRARVHGGTPAVGSASTTFAPHTFEPKERYMDRVALYLQDKHPIRDGMHYAQLAEQAGFEAVWQAESRLVREATVPMAAFAAVTERIAIGSGVVNTWTRNVGLLAATFSTLDDLAPGRVKLGVGAWWDPLAAKVGITAQQASEVHARDGRGDAPPARDGARHLPRRVRAPRRRRDRHRPRRPLAEARPDLHRRDRDEDDGARRRDRRRRPAQLPRRARVQPRRDGAPRRGRRARGAHRRRRRPAAARRLLARRRPLPRARPRARARRRSTSGSSRTS